MFDSPTHSRREVLRKTGGLAGASAVISTAGCLGDGDGGGPTTLTSTAFPTSGAPRIAIENAIDSGIADDHLNDVGYEVEVEFTFDGPPLITSGQADMASGDLSSFEASLIAQEHDLEFVSLSRVLSTYFSPTVAEGSDYAVGETGGPSETFQALADDDAQIGIGGWSAGNIPVTQMVTDRLYDLEFTREGDFNVVEVDYGAMPDLIKEGELAMGVMGILINPGPYMEGGLDVLFFLTDLAREQGWGIPPLGEIVVERGAWEEHEEGFRAWNAAYRESMGELEENPIDLAIEYDGGVGAEDEDVIETVIRFSHGELTNDFGIPEPDIPPVYIVDPSLTDEYIDETTTFLDEAASIGALPDNWNEFVTYEQTS